MKNRRIGCSLSRTINMGNFESIRVQVDLSCDIGEEQNLDEERAKLFELVQSELEMRCDEYMDEKPKRAKRGKFPE